MRLLLFVCFACFVILPSLVVAQEKSITPVETKKKVISWEITDSPTNCCSNYMDNNQLVTTYKDDKLIFSMSVYPALEKKYVILNIVFANKTDKPFTIHPNNFSMRMTEPENKTYPAVPAEEVAKKIEKRGNWKLLFASMFAGMATSQSTATITDNRGDQANVIVTEPNKQAQKNIENARRQQVMDNQSKADKIRSVSLPTHTLFKEEIMGGFVFFKKEKLTEGMIISFEIDGTIYEIPFGTEREKLNQKAK